LNNSQRGLIYFVYHTKSSIYKFIDEGGRELAQGNMILSDAKEISCTPHASIFLLQQKNKTSMIDRELVVNKWCANMIHEKVENSKSSKTFYGLLGMEKLYQDLVVFGQQGNDKWMEQWSNYIQYELCVIAKIRIGNMRFIAHNRNYKNLNPIFQPCINCWDKYFVDTTKKYNLQQLSECLYELIGLEKSLFQTLQSSCYSRGK
jgi:hypothetical protein